MAGPLPCLLALLLLNSPPSGHSLEGGLHPLQTKGFPAELNLGKSTLCVVRGREGWGGQGNTAYVSALEEVTV